MLLEYPSHRSQAEGHQCSLTEIAILGVERESLKAIHSRSAKRLSLRGKGLPRPERCRVETVSGKSLVQGEVAGAKQRHWPNLSQVNETVTAWK